MAANINKMGILDECLLTMTLHIKVYFYVKTNGTL